MNRGDVSFTFLDRVREVEWNIKDERWQSALALALTLPDICGGIAYPELVRTYRDGRVVMDRYGKPSRDIGNQYMQWFDEYAARFFYRNEQDERPYIDGARCWQLRCEYLHQNKGFVNQDEEQETHFHLGLNCGSSICQCECTKNENSNIEDIRLDIEQLCRRLCLAARAYYEEYSSQKDFSLYNTPVIDFVEWTNSQEDKSGMVLILVKDSVMGRGIQAAAGKAVKKIFCFDNVRDALKRAESGTVLTWMIEDIFFREKESLRKQIRGGKVVRLCLDGAENVPLSKDGMQILSLPCSLKELREAILD